MKRAAPGYSWTIARADFKAEPCIDLRFRQPPRKNPREPRYTRTWHALVPVSAKAAVVARFQAVFREAGFEMLRENELKGDTVLAGSNLNDKGVAYQWSLSSVTDGLLLLGTTPCIAGERYEIE